MTGLRIGIVGMGGAGRAHARRFARHPRVASVVGHDVKAVRYRDVDFEPDADRFLDRVDAVSICTPDATHLDWIERCLERARHVLVEKPMTASAAEARDLDALLVRRSDLTFAVHHQMRCVPAFARAKALIEDGTLGEIFYVEANYWHDNRERSVRFDDWRRRGAGQSVIFGGLCHPLDLLLHLVDRPVVGHETFANKLAFTALPAPHTAATTLLAFEGGIVGKAHCNSCAVFPQLNNLVVLGDRGSYIDGILYRDGRARDTVAANERYDSARLRRSLPARLLWNPLATLLTAVSMRHPLFRAPAFSAYNHEHACRRIVDDFVDAILEGGPVLVGYDEARRIIELCEDVERDAIVAEPSVLVRSAA